MNFLIRSCSGCMMGNVRVSTDSIDAPSTDTVRRHAYWSHRTRASNIHPVSFDPVSLQLPTANMLVHIDSSNTWRPRLVFIIHSYTDTDKRPAALCPLLYFNDVIFRRPAVCQQRTSCWTNRLSPETKIIFIQLFLSMFSTSRGPLCGV